MSTFSPFLPLSPFGGFCGSLPAAPILYNLGIFFLDGQLEFAHVRLQRIFALSLFRALLKVQ